MKRKVFFRAATILLLLLTQLSFLFAIFRENTNSYLIITFIALLGVIMLYTYRKAEIHHHELEFESFSMILWVLIGTVSTFYLHHSLKLGPVLSASSVGLAASFIPNIKKGSVYLKQLPAAIYCGAFVGMSSPKVADSLTFILIAGLLTGVLLVVSKSLLKGIGGRLGTLAFLGVMLTYLIIYILQ